MLCLILTFFFYREYLHGHQHQHLGLQIAGVSVSSVLLMNEYKNPRVGSGEVDVRAMSHSQRTTPRHISTQEWLD